LHRNNAIARAWRRSLLLHATAATSAASSTNPVCATPRRRP